MKSRTKRLTSAICTLIALQVATLITIVGLTWYLYGDLTMRITTAAAGSGRANPPEAIAEWRYLERAHSPAQGPGDAEVVLIEFTDFQCPFCKQFSEGARQRIADEFGADVRMVIKHYPLEQIHPYAMTAAIAAQCAHREGRFWDVKTRFFERPDALDVEDVLRAGEELGLSSSYFDCVRNEETRSEVEQDIADALEAGVPATPTFVINGRFLVGVQSPATFRSAFIDAGLVIR